MNCAIKRGESMGILKVIALVLLVVMLGTGIFSGTDDAPEKEGCQSPPVEDVQKDNTVQQNDTEELETPEDLEKFLEERYSAPQDIVDFLSEDAIQKCLEYHVFEDPRDWELNLLQLPPAEERVCFFSRGIMCYHLIDDYYIYVDTVVWKPEDTPAMELSIRNDETGKCVFLMEETFPEVLKLLEQRDRSSAADKSTPG